METGCPRCHSDNTSSFQMIYQSGTATGNFQSLSYNADIGFIGTGGKSQSQSLLAQTVTPPIQPSDTRGIPLLILLLVSLVVIPIIALLLSLIHTILAYLGVIACIGLVVFVGYKIWVVFTQSYDQTYEYWKRSVIVWQNSWMCLKCGWSWNISEQFKPQIGMKVKRPFKQQKLTIRRTDLTIDQLNQTNEVK